MGTKVSISTPMFVESMSVVLNATNPGINLNKKTIVLCYHFVREHVANNIVEVRKINTINNFADPFSTPLASNDLHKFYHECMVNGQERFWSSSGITQCWQNN